MVLVSLMASDVAIRLFASIVTVLVSDIRTSANMNLVAATDMVDVAAMATVTLDVTLAPVVMELVAVMFTAGSNVPLE